MILEYASLAVVLALGIITSYEDIKKGKIRNKLVFSAIIIGILLNASVMFYSFNQQYLINYCTNLAISITTGYVLWEYKMWSAGDGKLFISFASLLPLAFYSNGFVKYFPSFTLLFNTFIPFGMLLFLRSLSMKNIIGSISQIKKELSIIEMIKSLVSVIGIYWFVTKALSFVNHELLKYFIVVLLLMLFRFYFEEKYIYVGIVFFILRLFGGNILTKEFLIQTVLIFVLFQLLRTSVTVLTNKYKDETTHFAIYLFFGTLLTIICAGNFIIKILSFFQ